jgi:hypothetical protein
MVPMLCNILITLTNTIVYPLHQFKFFFRTRKGPPNQAALTNHYSNYSQLLFFRLRGFVNTSLCYLSKQAIAIFFFVKRGLQ